MMRRSCERLTTPGVRTALCCDGRATDTGIGVADLATSRPDAKDTL